MPDIAASLPVEANGQPMQQRCRALKSLTVTFTGSAQQLSATSIPCSGVVIVPLTGTHSFYWGGLASPGPNIPVAPTDVKGDFIPVCDANLVYLLGTAAETASVVILAL